MYCFEDMLTPSNYSLAIKKAAESIVENPEMLAKIKKIKIDADFGTSDVELREAEPGENLYIPAAEKFVYDHLEGLEKIEEMKEYFYEYTNFSNSQVETRLKEAFPNLEDIISIAEKVKDISNKITIEESNIKSVNVIIGDKGVRQASFEYKGEKRIINLDDENLRIPYKQMNTYRDRDITGRECNVLEYLIDKSIEEQGITPRLSEEVLCGLLSDLRDAIGKSAYIERGYHSDEYEVLLCSNNEKIAEFKNGTELLEGIPVLIENAIEERQKHKHKHDHGPSISM